MELHLLGNLLYIMCIENLWETKQIDEYVWQVSYKVLQDRWINIDVLYEMERPGGRLNKKDGLTRYGDSHVKGHMEIAIRR